MFNIFKKNYNATILPFEQNKISSKNFSNTIIINLIGLEHDIKIACDEIISVLNKNNISYKIISIVPSVLALESTNNIPKWRIDINKEIHTNKNVILNKIGLIDSDSLTDLHRSINALSSCIRPLGLYVDKKLANLLDVNEKHEHFQIINCSQINGIYPLKESIDKKEELIKNLLQ